MPKAPSKHPLVLLLTSPTDKANTLLPGSSLAICDGIFLGFLCVLLATSGL